MSKRVAIFDSGVGGLSLVDYLKDQKPQAVSYLLDNKYFPYGTKTIEELVPIIQLNIEQLKRMHEIIIIACNTGSMIYEEYLPKIEGVYPIISRTVLDVVREEPHQKVGLIGTDRLVASNIYQRRLKEQGVEEVIAQGASELVELIEDFAGNDVINDYIKTHYHVFKEAKINQFILGCTHFNWLKPHFELYFGHEVRIVPSGYALVDDLIKEDSFSNDVDAFILTENSTDMKDKIKKFIKSNHNFITL